MNLQTSRASAAQYPDAGKAPRNQAFTLVELLVVIGIIALLISVLFPALHSARAHAQMISCSSNLHQLATAAVTYSLDHQGYLPLAGELVVQPGSGMDRYAAPLSDSGQRRYTWSRAVKENILIPAVLPAALGKYLGVNDLPLDDVIQLDLAMADPHFQRLFSCPSTDSMSSNRAAAIDGIGQGLFLSMATSASTDVSAGSTEVRLSAYTDYAYNEGLFGFHYDQKYKSRRLRGQLIGQKRSAELVLFSDAKMRSEPAYPGIADQKAPWIAWTPSLESPGAVSLADAYEEKPGIARAGCKSMFDLQRHDGKMNVAFADGHVDAFDIQRDATHVREELRQAYLLTQ